MKRLLKGLMAIVGICLLLLIGAVVAVTTLFEPNDYRGHLERIAQEQGVPLHLRGDIGWQLWPRLGLSVADVAIGTGDQPLMTARKLSGQVALMPLLKGQVQVDALILDGADVHMILAADGTGNWETLMESTADAPSAKPDSTGSAEESSSASTLALAIDQLQMTNLSLSYQDRVQGTQVAVQDLNLTAQGVNLDGHPLSVQHSMVLALPNKPPLELRSKGTISVDLETSVLDIDTLELTAIANQAPLTVNLQGKVQWDTLATDVSLALTPVNLSKWLTQWQVELPEMSAADALTRVSLNASLSGSESLWQVQNIRLALDDSLWLGSAEANAAGALRVDIEGDRLVLDRYLPTPVPESVQSTAPAASGSNPKTDRVVPKMSSDALPLESLEGLNIGATIKVASLSYQQIPLTNVLLDLSAKDGSLRLKALSTNIEAGVVKLQGALSTSTTPSQLTMTGEFQQLPLHTLLNGLTQESRINGEASGQFSMATQGDTLRQWQEQLQAQLTLTAQSLTFDDFDVERSACELSALINQEAAPTLDWKGHTQLQDVQASLTVAGETVNLTGLAAGVENLRVKAKGRLGLDSGQFDVPLDVAFSGTADPDRQCQVRDRWRNRDLPLRCSGQLNAVSARTCLPDRKRIDDLLRDELKQKASDKLQEKLQEKLGTEKGQAVESLLKGLFGR